MVGDPGIEPGVGLPGGVTVRCRTLQLVALMWRFDTEGPKQRQGSKLHVSTDYLCPCFGG